MREMKRGASPQCAAFSVQSETACFAAGSVGLSVLWALGKILCFFNVMNEDEFYWNDF